MSGEMHSLLYLFILLFTELLIKCDHTLAKVEVCGNTNIESHGIDLSALDWTTWSLTQTKPNSKERVDYSISICSPFNSSADKECNNSYICRHNRTDNRAIGYSPKSIEVESTSGSNIQSAVVLFEGPPCDHNPILNYTIKMRFNCGPHLEYPQHYIDITSRCVTELFWRTYAVCKEKSVQNAEVKCYVYDDNGLRRDLTPLIKPNGGSYKVLSQDQDFYINVCSNVSRLCSESDTGACLKTGENKYIKVGDFRYNTLEFKNKTAVVPYEHIEMTYKTKSSAACGNMDANYTSVTTIRFICPPKQQKRSIDFVNRNPKLVSNLDCDYQIEWLTEYACPLNTIKVPATKCQLTEEVHGIDFNLKTLMKSNYFYKIENIAINKSNSQSRYDIHFNVCGGLGKDYGMCGTTEWESNAVCLKAKDNHLKDKVIGLTSGGSLKLVDNRFLLEYQTKTNDCKLGEISISETTLIEFVCDDTKGFEYLGKPEFISFEDCTYYIIWKTSVVCPVISSNTSCVTSYKNFTFDLSQLRKGFDGQPWTASVSQTLPWSRLAKDEKDTIFLNVCGVVPKAGAAKSCDARSSACMTVSDTNTTINLGHFGSAPKYNEDIKAIELIYENGFDYRRNQTVKSKIVLRCKPGSYNSEPTLVDVDEEIGTYHFEWETWAACPIDSVAGTDCKVYDSFLDYTFDLNPLRTITPYLIKDNGYEFQISVCGELKSDFCNAKNITTATGPFGVCQVELEGGKRPFSLGKANTNITYWNGVINMTFTDGTPYNNPLKTPRKSHIAFICDPNVGKGNGPEYDGERNRSYFFRWYTPLACPHNPKTVHCVWENGSHVLDLTPLTMTTGNHFAVGLPATGTTDKPSIYYINICRPLNQIHDKNLERCGSDSAACRLIMDANKTVLSLGKATRPPFRGFDGSISLIYEDGSPCPTNRSKNITTRIKFECDPHSDLANPIVHTPGSDLTDNEECVYLFEWSTSAVCDIMTPTILETNSCIFTDNVTKLSADLSSLRRTSSEQPYKVAVHQNQATYELNFCGVSNPLPSDQCSNSAVCYRTNGGSQTSPVVSYGLLNSSTFFYDGKYLRLRYHNGSKCTAHNDTQMMSSEIIFKCNPDSKQTEPKLHSSHACVAVFDWETNLVCNLRPQKCSIAANNQFYNLRQLSSLSHGWNTTDKDGNVYYLNVCAKLPANVKCKGVSAASCKCDKQLDCSESLGDPSADELQVISNGTLQLTYKNGEEEHCPQGLTAQTQIIFKCGSVVGNPKFIEFNEKTCVYKFEWNTLIACPVTDTDDVLFSEQNGFLHDKRLDIYINVGPLINQNFTVKEHRMNSINESQKIDEYDYVINLSSPPLSPTPECSKAAVCQTKSNGFKRDIGTIDTIKYYLRGHELQIVLESTTKKCGKNLNKNVTTIFRLFCSSRSGVGIPVFMYESNECDYTFNWETDRVCPQNFVEKIDFETIMKEQNTPTPETIVEDSPTKSGSKVWIGIVLVVIFIATLTIIVVYKQRVRQSLMFRFRRLFGPETSNHTFHYHQLESNEKDRQREEVVFISRNDAQNRNTIAAQASGPVPYYSIYDDSDVDLLA